MTPLACEFLSEHGFGFRKANVVGCRMFARHFPSDEVQDEAEVRGNAPVSAHDWSKNTAAVAVFIDFALYLTRPLLPYSLTSLSIGLLWSSCVPCSSKSSFLCDRGALR